MALSSSLLPSIPMVAPVAKVAPFSMAAPAGVKVAPVSVSKVVAPMAKFSPVASVKPFHPSTDFVLPLSRSDFPKDFIFGAATAAYQVEGGKEGRGPTAWDHFTHNYPEKISDRSTGDVACGSIDLYMKDIELMNEMGLDAYNFSICWSRILPTGKRSGGISKEGIKYYNELIDQLILNGKTPFVKLYHVDRPHALEEEYGGFLDSRMIDDFKDFADVCFENFGGKVKHWFTLNEPYTYCHTGYVVGSMAPGRCSYWQKLNCLGGDSATEPYTVGHNLLLAHSAAVDLYNTKYKQSQKGQIDITLDSIWCVPYSDRDYDKQAALRGMDFKLGWFLEPLKSGKYPESMQQLVGDRLPKFTEEQSKKLKGSYDFIGINYYTSQFAADKPVITTPPSNLTDAFPIICYMTDFRDGVAIGGDTASGMYVYPQGLRELMRYIKKNYNDPIIYITENGMADYNDMSLFLDEACMDIRRIDYYYRHLYHLLYAIKEDNVKVKGYFAWSLLDNFEWALGYTLKFGMHFTDYNDLKRHPKYSAQWFKQFLNK